MTSFREFCGSGTNSVHTGPVGPFRGVGCANGSATGFLPRRPRPHYERQRQDDEEAATENILAAQELDLGDRLTFVIERMGPDEPQGVGLAVRFRAVATLGGRLFDSVLVDVGFGDLPVLVPDMIVTPDLLGFADLPPVRVPTCPSVSRILWNLPCWPGRSNLALVSCESL
jgi:hypothetical protein